MSCNLQRVITLEPGGFSRQLLYHTSNNKQRQQNVRHRFSSRSINQFWGQLNTIRKNAEMAMKKEMQEEMESGTKGYSV
jgi:predicted transcriptional regulator